VVRKGGTIKESDPSDKGRDPPPGVLPTQIPTAAISAPLSTQERDRTGPKAPSQQSPRPYIGGRPWSSRVRRNKGSGLRPGEQY
jgi:hypothetical protein